MKKRCCLSSPQQNGGGSEQAGAACACGDRETLSGGPARWEPARFEERTSVYRETVAISEKEAAFPEKTAGYGVVAIMGDLREKQTKQCAVRIQPIPFDVFFYVCTVLAILY